jgi:glucose-1-phosphate thymidylyltransferase
VPDPRRFGVAEVNDEGWVTRFIEKPESKDNNLVVVGCYYFQSGENLMAAIEEQFNQDVKLKNEFFLTDAISIMIEKGALVRTEIVDTWLDAGTIDATLETNATLLERMDAKPEERPTVKIVPPVFIHPTAVVSEAVIGPNVSIGPNCKINQAVIQDSIIEEGTQITKAALTHSLIGRNCVVEGQPNKEEASSLNIGDNSNVRFEA